MTGKQTTPKGLRDFDEIYETRPLNQKRRRVAVTSKFDEDGEKLKKEWGRQVGPIQYVEDDR
jgi:hypothetical protein